MERDTVDDRAVRGHVDHRNLGGVGGVVNVELIDAPVASIDDEQPLGGRVMRHDFRGAQVKRGVIGEPSDGSESEIQRLRWSRLGNSGYEEETTHAAQ